MHCGARIRRLPSADRGHRDGCAFPRWVLQRGGLILVLELWQALERFESIATYVVVRLRARPCSPRDVLADACEPPTEHGANAVGAAVDEDDAVHFADFVAGAAD